MIILDFGSATTCKNDKKYVERMIDELSEVDSGKHDIVIKWQLFSDTISSLPDGTVLDPPVEPLDRCVFHHAYMYAQARGYQTTASVFDKDSLDFLLEYDIPFVKIANRPDRYWLAGEVPRRIPLLVSTDGSDYGEWLGGFCMSEWVNFKEWLFCISKYPATLKDYEDKFKADMEYAMDKPPLSFGKRHNYCGLIGADDHWGISDHTTDFELYHKYRPDTIEWHYKLEDSTGPDAGEFARTPEQLREIL